MNRITKFQKSIKGWVLIENPVDLFYLTGLKLSRGALLIGDEVTLFVDGRYFAKAKNEAPCAVRPLEEMNLKGKQIQVDSFFTTMDRCEALKKETEILGHSRLLKRMRSVKELKEIEALKRAARITYKGFEHVASLLKTGVSEEELAFEFEVFVRKQGASGLSFEPIIAFGENSAYPHHRAGKSMLKKDQIVLIDVGAVVDQYAGDLTRVVFFGQKDPELARMLELTQNAQKEAINAIRKGATFGSLDVAARRIFVAAGVEALFTHSLGHGIGLETHEFPAIKATSPDRDEKIEPSMAFTIEPGLYKPGLGGVRWEDVIIVTDSGYELC